MDLITQIAVFLGSLWVGGINFIAPPKEPPAPQYVLELAATPSATPTLSPTLGVYYQPEDEDPDIVCGPFKDGQTVTAQRSVCAQMVSCQLGDRWIPMMQSECTEAQGAESADTYIVPPPIYEQPPLDYSYSGPSQSFPPPATMQEDEPIDAFGGSRSYTKIGDTWFGSEGDSYTRIGDTVFGSEGTSYNQIGDTMFGSDGSSYTRIGDTLFGGDGTSYTKIGDTTFGSDGSTSTRIGDTVFFNP